MIKIYEIQKGQLYQSPEISSTADFKRVLNKGIRVVLDIEGKEDIVDDRLVYFLFWPIEDKDAPSRERLDLVASFGAACIKQGLKTLVHCGAGLNRSSLVSARILMMLNGLTGRQAIAQVRKYRSGALNNKKFVKMLLSLPNKQPSN